MITIDLDLYYACVGSILIALASVWGFRRVKSLLSAR